MAKPLVYRSEAKKDLGEIEEYYDKISPSITNNFFKEYFLTLKYIKLGPEMFQVRYRGIRIAPLYRFPYGIHYSETTDAIIIYRILHTKRYFK
ncbi:type II toxin-antitoxin system RelE/ParE family toxin [Mucilaginibacter sp. ZT4R22]|uniref:Type II toxin-antitoxin system RelE/ParE family toxin n=1 Tax=Mucilaginibacter pankratovii TaxID=2772110 RepID=A0ABR7WVG1_9SPHI|nr:type II toxin-antitoxin system RelE/ParE family toxin [Mucilaginibacter pankratovii]